MRTKVLAFLFVLSFMACSLNAQNRQQSTPEERAERHTKSLTEKLKLSDEQKTKVYEVTLKYAKQRTSQSGTEVRREKRMEEFQEMQKKQDEELNSIFTEDQKKGYEKYQKETRSKRGENRKQR